MSRALPPAARRLFAHERAERIGLDGAGDFVIERLLEEGDRNDLQWLAAVAGEKRLADWLGRRGGRRLSPRSRRFWEMVLGVRGGGEHPLASELWPL